MITGLSKEWKMKKGAVIDNTKFDGRFLYPS